MACFYIKKHHLPIEPTSQDFRGHSRAPAEVEDALVMQLGLNMVVSFYKLGVVLFLIVLITQPPHPQIPLIRACCQELPGEVKAHHSDVRAWLREQSLREVEAPELHF